MLLAQTIAPAIVFLSLFALPESPRWLLMMGYKERGEHVMSQVFSAEEVEEMKTVRNELENVEIKQQQSHPCVNSDTSERQCICFGSKATRRAWLIALGVFGIFQMSTGVEAATYYMPEILESAGVGVAEKQLVFITILIGILKLFAVLVGLSLVDSTGRRPLLLLSAIGMATGQAITAVGYLVGVPWVNIVGQCALLAFYAVGFGPVAPILASEVLPLRARASALGIIMMVCRYATCLGQTHTLCCVCVLCGLASSFCQVAMYFVDMCVLIHAEYFYRSIGPLARCNH
eukprot:SAG31_NODE_1380_length_8582_cov_4.390192_1_plen_289_part_00